MKRNSHSAGSGLATLLLVVLAAAMSRTTARASCDQSQLLGSPVHYTSGPATLFLATGDFNEDGFVDVVVSNSDFTHGGIASSLGILLGNGPGTFGPVTTYQVGHDTHGVVAEDFNGDGILDLAVAVLGDDKVAVLLGLGSGGVGNGTFAAHVDYACGNAPFKMIAADVDGDGITDLAAALNENQAVCVLRGLGNGTFASPILFGIHSISTGIAAADFNLDGRLDLVATEYYTGNVAVLYGTGALPFGASSFSPAVSYSGGGNPFDVEVADFNEDGRPDLAVANTTGMGTRILLGTPGGFLSSGTLGSGNSGSVEAADFNQDGILDLAITHNDGENSGFLNIFLGQGTSGVGNGTFGPATNHVGGYDPYQILSGDYDGDGHRDLLTTARAGNFVAFIPGVCTAAPPDPRNPVLTDVRDVPNDNGGKVFLTWTASSLDVSGGPVNQYRVWRRIPSASLLAPGRESAASLRTTTRAVRADGTTDIVYWEALATLPAQRMAGYGYTAATTQDSMRHSNPYTAFFVSALTSDIDVFYSSNVDSGYSVDNIHPHRPENVTGAMESGGAAIQWDANTDQDLAQYRVYRGSVADFEPSESNRIGVTSEPGYVDAGATGAEFYKLSAVDAHENESDFAVVQPLGLAGVDHGVGAAFALRGARPNPARGGRWTIDLSLANGGAARLELLDLSGRRIAVRDLRAAAAGPQSVVFEAKERLAPGVYLVRLTQGARKSQIKAVVIQ